MDNDWKTGYPERIGPYVCRVDGKEKTLLHKYCELNGKHRWMTLQGGDVIGEVEWRGMLTNVNEMK